MSDFNDKTNWLTGPSKWHENINLETRTEYDKDGFDKKGFDKNGLDRKGFNKYKLHINGTKFDNDGFDFYGYDKDGYDKNGYNLFNWDRNGTYIDGSKYDKNGFDVNGMHCKTGKKFDEAGYDKDGFNSRGINRRHFYKNGTFEYNKNKIYDNYGYDIDGYDKYGWDKDGYDRFGINCYGKNKAGEYPIGYGKRESFKKWHNCINFKTGKLLDIDGYDVDGYNREGFNRNGFDRDGYDKDGYNIRGFNSQGLNRTGLTYEQQLEQNKLDEVKKQEEKDESKKQALKNYLGLKNKAEKLGKGEMSLEDYIKKSKTSIEDLITFAKKENMSADVIRGLYKNIAPYKQYKKPFSKKDYIGHTTLIINGAEIQPTEEDVDRCIAYLNATDSLVCDKTVKDLVRKHLKGEVDITVIPDEHDEEKATNEISVLVDDIIEKQETIKEQQKEINNLKIQRR